MKNKNRFLYSSLLIFLLIFSGIAISNADESQTPSPSAQAMTEAQKTALTGAQTIAKTCRETALKTLKTARANSTLTNDKGLGKAYKAAIKVCNNTFKATRATIMPNSLKPAKGAKANKS